MLLFFFLMILYKKTSGIFKLRSKLFLWLFFPSLPLFFHNMKLFPEFQNHLPKQITSTMRVTAIPPPHRPGLQRSFHPAPLSPSTLSARSCAKKGHNTPSSARRSRYLGGKPSITLSFSKFQNMMGTGGCRDGSQKTQVQSPTSTWWLTTLCNSI